MYDNMNSNIAIEYDENIISKLKEMIEYGWEKLKHFVKSISNGNSIVEDKTNLNLSFFYDLKQDFNEISLKLKELGLCEELRYFLSISHFIKYIVYKNSLDTSFGYCNFALDLLKFFSDLFKKSLEFYINPNKCSIDEFQMFKEEIKKKHWGYRREFYWDIYDNDDDFDEEKMYEFAKSLRG